MKKIACIVGMIFCTTMTMAQKKGNPTAPPATAENTTVQQQKRSSTIGISQDFTMPVASPKATTKQQFSTSNIELEYSRPSVKGRKIFGGMVAFGKPWRTGANAITKITFGEEVIFGGQRVEAGTYALYTIPNQKSWTVLLNTNHKSSGLNDINHEEDIAKVEVKPTILKESVETFTIELNNISNTNASLNIIWENTKVTVPIVADNHERIIAYLEEALHGDRPPYRDAAFYFEETGHDLKRAVEFADRALEENPRAFWIHSLKARIFSKLGDKQQAVRSAETAAEMTRGTGYEEEYKKKVEDYR